MGSSRPRGLPPLHPYVAQAVRFFFALLRISHMLRCLCGPPSIPLSLALRPYSPCGTLNALAAARGIVPPHLGVHRLRLGLPVSNPCSLPPAFSRANGLGPEGRLRHRCSTRYLRIPPLPPGVPPCPYRTPSRGGSGASGLSPPLRPPARRAAYARFTPNESG